ncbi:hypothetical protein MKW98_023637 [Papaver atlanticum]|uniref:Cullin N-terminal domain-containing protein n=1 Tax=Papaver atlanticum TaxID=357466 RepID=A0AAD4SZM4_9MAGN|nr:hypothetical protein MKW98_023637 [Papaver atlanticum]
MIRTVDKKLIIEFQEGWEFIMQRGINKLVIYLEEGNARRYPDDPPFSSEECMMLYTTIFNMCTQKPPHEHTHQLYDYYVMAFESTLMQMWVLPSLREAHDEFLLRELVQWWMNHKIMVKWLSKFFCYLDRYFLAARCLPPVKDVGLHCFRKLLYEEINGRVKDAVISLINREREGEQIDRTLVKNVLHIFVEIGIENMECYLNEFGIPCQVSSDPREECLQRKKLHGGTRTSNSN